MVIVGATGFFSHAAYNPDLGRNAIVPRDHDFQLLVFNWPTRPTWLFALNQSLHTIVGIIAVPLLLAKLWSVIPKLFAWPPVASPAKALERLSLLGLVGGAIFQFGTGIFNAQLYYPWHFNFVVAHYYGAWVFLTALFLHVAIKLPTMRTAIRERGALQPLHRRHRRHRGRALRARRPGAAGPRAGDDLAARRLRAGRRRLGRAVRRHRRAVDRRAAALGRPAGAARPRVDVPGQQDRAAGARDAGDGRRRVAAGAVGRRRQRRALSRAALLAMPQHSYDLPIACVEGWTTTQRWTGVRLKDLAAARAARARTCCCTSSRCSPAARSARRR